MKKADILLISGMIALAAVAALIIMKSSNDSGVIAVVTVDGREYGAYPLDEDITVPITQENGAENTLVIKDGQAFMRGASCPDRLCEKQGRKTRSGESIVCLPNRVVVTLEGEESEIDTVAQ